ncbi:uncharacterized protein Z519_02499 [Cladophialophora bantiana CBS 173.52]|uniref:BTB domain-containing protein n=1 Tax=Cladophialophora bantiana (strain ATCC 10958 / CBS 173.52 / CDC B-1940 / NIH 8579) TaxID=1442370 RepID=A0A0D2GFH0_CLAB1|nr:uncharacterized protein Z519_02499 [Cladophialophora bantiana CBS 173.52]KIW97107.1 hypothetical protein Z519_02499 [Cladophialophora bantiana CBS 173.52]
MASPTRSDFPKFLDGDVLIIISTTQYYKLHSQVLSAHSSFFADQIGSEPGPRLTAQARRDNAAAYRFEFKRSPVENQFGGFTRVDINEAGRVEGPSKHVLMPDLENGKAADNTNRAWDWLFGIFYNREPVFDDSSLATVLSCVISLIECAESIGSLDHVRDVVDLALMRQDNVLWTSILGNPHVWIELGRRVRSPAIYSEAAIHLVGQWGTMTDEEKTRLSEDIRVILDRKAGELALVKEAIEIRILGHYPEFMRRSAADKPGRPSYSSDIYMWMAVGFFRQWFSQNISDDRTRRAPDGGFNFYAALHEGGQAYLNHMDFQEFHKYFPMSIKACHVLEANMGVLKEDVKRFVDDLMIERTHLKRDEHEIYWLTCAKIEKEDMPWYKPDPTANPTDALQSLYNAMDDEQATMRSSASADSGGKQKSRDSSNSSRPKKRARIDEDDGDYYDQSPSTLFVSPTGSDVMEE